MGKISVLIAEDHTIVREGLRMLLEATLDILVVGEAENGREAISLCEDLNPDVILMDIAMPTLNGIEATRMISKKYPGSKVIILSMYPDEEYVLEALNAGASGFLVKKTASKDLIEAIRQVNAGHAFFSPQVSKTVLDAYRKASEAPDTGQEPTSAILLTPREREILQLIAEGHTSKNIAKELFVSLKTVENHRQSIMRKLDIHDVAGLTRYAVDKGLTPGDRKDIG